MKSLQKPIVIVGAGFAGMTAALNLKSLNPSLPNLCLGPNQVTFLDTDEVVIDVSVAMSSWRQPLWLAMYKNVINN